MTKNKYPKIYLTIDNCFAIKRWVRPRDWMKVIHDIGGVSCIEASTDNEIDPLFNTEDFRNEWVDEVKQCEKKYGQKVVSFYSGYATYRTVGLASWAKSSRDIIKNCYFKNIIDTAAKLGAQVGNTLSAFSEPVLNDAEKYQEAKGFLAENLVEMTKYAADKKVTFGYEQMYTPNQGFWTIDGCRDWIKHVYAKAGNPMYITIDTAHQVGQHSFLPPTDEQLKQMLKTGDTKGFTLGRKVSEMIRAKKHSFDEVKQTLDEYAYLFSKPEDSDVFKWFSELGCYSPLVHLQQTDGTYSGHKPFTQKFNQTGIIDPKKVFAAIAESYDRQTEPGMPPKVKEIYLAFEIFFGITESSQSIIEALRESVEYWREYIPKDGLTLDELL